MSADRFVYHFHNSKRVELVDLAVSLHSLGKEYSQFVEDTGTLDPKNIKLYVDEVKTGSVLATLIPELVNNSEQVLAGIQATVGVIEFGLHLKNLLEWLLIEKNARNLDPRTFPKSSLQNIANLVAPVARDNNSNLFLNINGDNNKVTFVSNVTSEQAKQISLASLEELADGSPSVAGFHEKVLFKWSQIRNDFGNKTGDKGTIESIWKYPTKSVVLNEADKLGILSGDANAFKQIYLVDVEVHTVENIPKLYKIIKIHDVFE